MVRNVVTKIADVGQPYICLPPCTVVHVEIVPVEHHTLGGHHLRS